MKLGIIGLPNSGKTTLFNALTGQSVEAPVYPAQIGEEPHVGVIRVPDARIDRLSGIFEPKKTTYADVTCVDITGFARGISGNRQKSQVMNELWDVDAVIHIVRAFGDQSVVHPDGHVDPAADAAALELELVFSDLELVETRLERIANSMKKGVGGGLEGEQAVLKKCRLLLEDEQPLRNLQLEGEEQALIGSLQFASIKPQLVVLNVDEDEIGSPKTTKIISDLNDFYQGKQSLVFPLSARIEMELSQLPAEEAGDFLADLGIEEPAMNRVIHEAYRLLGLISFLTAGADEVRAWTIREDTPAVRAAGKIHSDIERGFIRAEVISYDDFIAAGAMARAKELGTLRLEGKEYRVQDGDIINFRFNV